MFHPSYELSKEFRPIFFYLKLLSRYYEIVGTTHPNDISVTDLNFE
jgi:hypothetical protein